MAPLFTGSKFSFINSSDQLFSLVNLLLHMDGANDSTTFTDSSINKRTATASGNAKISTAQKKFGVSSGLFDGSGDYVTIPNAGGLGTGDFTVELWVRPNTASTQSYGRFIQCGNFNVGGDWQLARNSLAGDSNPMTLLLDFQGGAFRITTGATVADNAWSHLAFSRQGTMVRLFINGTQVGSGNTSANLSQTTVVLGADASGNNAYAGYIDEVVITKFAKYTANFTPPAVPNPDG